jgi:DHA2 family multidrug resistance protein
MVNLRIFRVRNFAVGTVLIFLTSLLIYAISLTTPQFLQELMGYSSYTAGLAVAPIGVGAVISMVIVGKLASKIEPRNILIFGFLIFAFAAYQLSRISLDIAPWTIFWPQVLAGSAMGFLFVPINMAGTAPLRRDEIGSATGTFNLMRNVGGSVGIAMVSTFLARRSQIHQNMIVQHLSIGNNLMMQRLHGIQAFVFLRMPSSGDGMGPALGVLYRILQQQAHLLAFTDVYEGLVIVGLGASSLVFLMRKVEIERVSLRVENRLTKDSDIGAASRRVVAGKLENTVK